MQIAVSTINEVLSVHEIDVTIVVLDKQSVQISETLFNSVYQYIDAHLEERCFSYENFSDIRSIEAEIKDEENILQSYSSLEDLINQLEESLSQNYFV